MAKAERRQVRPIENPSMISKRFKPVSATSKRVRGNRIHPLLVVADLRNGSLVSLTRYLAQEKGIPDPAVAIALRKLISGSVCCSRYRLQVIEHPDRPTNKGGRPSGQEDEDTLGRYRRIVAKYVAALPLEREKKHLARATVAKKLECSETTVKRAIRAIREEQVNSRNTESERQAFLKTLHNRKAALSALREEAKIQSD